MHKLSWTKKRQRKSENIVSHIFITRQGEDEWYAETDLNPAFRFSGSGKTPREAVTGMLSAALCFFEPF